MYLPPNLVHFTSSSSFTAHPPPPFSPLPKAFSASMLQLECCFLAPHISPPKTLFHPKGKLRYFSPWGSFHPFFAVRGGWVVGGGYPYDSQGDIWAKFGENFPQGENEAKLPLKVKKGLGRTPLVGVEPTYIHTHLHTHLHTHTHKHTHTHTHTLTLSLSLSLSLIQTYIHAYIHLFPGLLVVCSTRGTDGKIQPTWRQHAPVYVPGV